MAQKTKSTSVQSPTPATQRSPIVVIIVAVLIVIAVIIAVGLRQTSVVDTTESNNQSVVGEISEEDKFRLLQSLSESSSTETITEEEKVELLENLGADGESDNLMTEEEKEQLLKSL